MKKIIGLIFCFLIIFVYYLYSDNNVLDTIMERRNKFINEGFGFNYFDDEIEDIYLFILKHGNPINVFEENVENIWDDIIDKNITLEYDTVSITFYKWLVRGTNNYKSLLLKIKSKDNIDYLYNIKHDLTINELEKIIGKIEFRGDDAFVLLYSENDHAVMIYFFEEKIENIEWYYLLQ